MTVALDATFEVIIWKNTVLCFMYSNQISSFENCTKGLFPGLQNVL